MSRGHVMFVVVIAGRRMQQAEIETSSVVLCLAKATTIATFGLLSTLVELLLLPLTLLQLSPVDDSQPSCSAELGPVCCPAEPLQVVPQECVDGGAGVHQGVGQDGG